MNPILLDTNAYAAFKQGDAEAEAILRQTSGIALNSIVLGELLAGFAFGSREEKNRKELVQFLDSRRVVVLSIDRRTSDLYATIYLALKKAATPIPTNDMWIAATALQHRLPLYTFDRHFRSVPGLQIGASRSELEQR